MGGAWGCSVVGLLLHSKNVLSPDVITRMSRKCVFCLWGQTIKICGHVHKSLCIPIIHKFLWYIWSSLYLNKDIRVLYNSDDAAVTLWTWNDKRFVKSINQFTCFNQRSYQRNLISLHSASSLQPQGSGNHPLCNSAICPRTFFNWLEKLWNRKRHNHPMWNSIIPRIKQLDATEGLKIFN